MKHTKSSLTDLGDGMDGAEFCAPDLNICTDTHNIILLPPVQ